MMHQESGLVGGDQSKGGRMMQLMPDTEAR